MAAKQWPLEDFLAWTISVITADGWVPRKDLKRGDGRKATVEKVVELMTPPENYDRYPELHRNWTIDHESYKPATGHYRTAKEIVRWALTLDDAQLNKSSFHHNVNVIARFGVVQRRVAGVAAAMVHAWDTREKTGVK